MEPETIVYIVEGVDAENTRERWIFGVYTTHAAAAAVINDANYEATNYGSGPDFYRIIEKTVNS